MRGDERKGNEWVLPDSSAKFFTYKGSKNTKKIQIRIK